MHHPLPEVPKAAPKAEDKQPFLGLNVVFGINVFLNIFSMVLFCFFPASDAETSALENQLVTGFSTIIAFVIDFYLWRGFNWARWVTVVVGGLSFLLLFSPEEYQSTFPQIERTYNLIGYSWWTGISVWLLLPAVARHFKSPSVKPVS